MNSVRLAVSFLIVETADIFSTSYAIEKLGMREGNPAAAHLFIVYGMWEVLVLKLIFSLVVVLAYCLSRRWQRALAYALSVSVVVTWLAVATNLILIIQDWGWVKLG